ncbi:HDL322Cp [Eremothecium sinecaudum]|uniref:Small ribosomal subunit protein uS7m n=1 Tax=Eremothecium sinecaudum TaxID=45286 RepID=A0A0X8HS00_9SACH|nr:HDL322Cp [Eremothecium sinecaudum]AMD20422.1 HDL322Cp [Eremothecium sinecaudum]
MFLLRRSLNARVGFTPSAFCAAIRPPVGVLQYRLQSTLPSNPPINAELIKNTDNTIEGEADRWIAALDELDKELAEGSFSEMNLSQQGVSGVSYQQLMETMQNKFEPTAEQLAEWESLKSVPIPLKKDEVFDQVVNMIMRHGKKEKAHKILSRALYIVFCVTRKDPLPVLKKSLDDLAPLMIVRKFKTRVAKAAEIPVPLTQRQRIRLAWKWILESSSKRKSDDIAVRLGQELVAVYKGESTGFQKRDEIHKSAIAHRAYIKLN